MTDENKKVAQSAAREASLSAPICAVICSGCGKRVTEGKLYVRGDLAPLKPVFCSVECEEADDPKNLTPSKLDGLIQWFNVEVMGGESASKQKE